LLVSIASGDAGHASGIPATASAEHSIAADDLYLLQHPRRAEVGAPERNLRPAPGKKGAVRHAPRDGIAARQSRAPRAAHQAAYWCPASSRHRAHLHPDATAPPESR
jgi:hypothetical protein